MTSQFDCLDATLVDGMVSDGDEGYEVASAAVENQRRVVIAFVGMAFEARIAAGPGVLVQQCGVAAARKIARPETPSTFKSKSR